MLDKTIRFRLIGVALMVVLFAGVLPIILDGERPPELDVKIQVESAPTLPSVKIPPLQPITSLGDNSVVEIKDKPPAPSKVKKDDDEVQLNTNKVEHVVIKASTPSTPIQKPTTNNTAPYKGVRWSVQIATFKSKSNADNLVKKLIKAKYAAYSITTNSLYKVYVGPEIKREKAESYREKIEKEFRLNGLIVKYSEN
ncbi:SPOR domain-containing protein [Marinomonas sp. 2405UD68-3]|uniref:SPOR domain-containing protein n=1 Tax=Marinomonas sp. 2405UD68-3 TaxID=3391835 RepID=UPI0039C8E2C6